MEEPKHIHKCFSCKEKDGTYVSVVEDPYNSYGHSPILLCDQCDTNEIFKR